MSLLELPSVLPAALGLLHQRRESGVLVLEQNDGTRHMYWEEGRIVQVQSEAAGDQFGNYLLRQGVIDFPTLNQLLESPEGFRVGEKVVQWGLLTPLERDRHLLELQNQIMVHILEHTVVNLEWRPGPVRLQLGDFMNLPLEHPFFVWNSFWQSQNEVVLIDLFYDQPSWRWVACGNLMDALQDLPLTPQMAYSISIIGKEPLGFETFVSLSGMQEDSAAKFVATLWALGLLRLSDGDMSMFGHASDAKLPFAPVTAPLPPLPVAPLPAPQDAPTPQRLPEQLHHTWPALEFENKEHLEAPCRPLPLEPAEEPVVVESGPPDEDPKLKARKCYCKAKALLLQSRTGEAIRLLEHSVKLDGESESSFHAWLHLGKERMANPAWSTRAIEALQNATRIRPKAAEPWALMGEIYHRKGFKANAVACFNRALDLDPSVAVPADFKAAEDIPEEDPGSKKTGILDRFKSILGKNL